VKAKGLPWNKKRCVAGFPWILIACVGHGKHLPEVIKTREIAAFLMGQLGSPAMPKREASYPYLTEMLHDKDDGVRASAASAIGHLSYQGMPQFVEQQLVTRARDRNKHVRAAVAYALGNSSGTGQVLAALQLLLKDRHAKSYAELGMDILSGRTHDGARKSRKHALAAICADAITRASRSTSAATPIRINPSRSAGA
jgi:hypothetical protein